VHNPHPQIQIVHLDQIDIAQAHRYRLPPGSAPAAGTPDPRSAEILAKSYSRDYIEGDSETISRASQANELTYSTGPSRPCCRLSSPPLRSEFVTQPFHHQINNLVGDWFKFDQRTHCEISCNGFLYPLVEAFVFYRKQHRQYFPGRSRLESIVEITLNPRSQPSFERFEISHNRPTLTKPRLTPYIKGIAAGSQILTK